MCNEVKIDYEMQPMVAEKAKHCDKQSGGTIWEQRDSSERSIKGTESDAPLLGGRAGRKISTALDFKLTYSALEFILFSRRVTLFI